MPCIISCLMINVLFCHMPQFQMPVTDHHCRHAIISCFKKYTKDNCQIKIWHIWHFLKKFFICLTTNQTINHFFLDFIVFSKLLLIPRPVNFQILIQIGHFFCNLINSFAAKELLIIFFQIDGR